MRHAASLVLALIALAGCNSPDDGRGHGMGPDSMQVHMSGVPAMPMAPGQMFNVSIQAMHGMGMEGMETMMSDHRGAHFWNATTSDPTAGFAASKACVHNSGDLPGEWTAQCVAPMEPGTYHMRGHARMTDDDQTMHHWWSDEQTFTVA